MVNQTLVQSLPSLWPPSAWESHCISQLITSGYNWTHGLVNMYGQSVPVLTDNTWGITMALCKELCNHDTITYPLFDFQSFQSCITNYFLPWLALTAQLPFETGDFANNFMSFCLAVGSPALVTYSLTITIMNRRWVKKIFGRLRKRAGPIDENNRGFITKLVAARRLLQEGQQAPLRVSQKDGWLSCLVVLPDNTQWWDNVEKSLEDTRRGVTASLVAQMSFAIIAYLLTIIAAYISEFGDPTIALQIASGSLWLWLVPVIIGWIVDGTQYQADTVQRALEKHKASKAHEYDHDNVEEDVQEGLIVAEPEYGLSPLPARNLTGLDGHDTNTERYNKIPDLLGCSVQGDELRQGPIFNYARSFTWCKVVKTLHSAFEQTLDNLERKIRCHSPHEDMETPWDPARTAEYLRGNSGEVARYCDLANSNKVLAYAQWREIEPDVVRSIWVGIAAALFVQFGTTGASILIAYLTPTKGVGCRSGSYALYGILALTVFACMWTSAILSHQVMLMHQDQQLERQSPMRESQSQGPGGFPAAHEMTPIQRSTLSPTNESERTSMQQDQSTLRGSGQISTYKHEEISQTFERTPWYNFLAGLAILLRRAGKFIAFLNAFWLIASSLMEFIGVFDTCWCQGDYLGLGKGGWIVLFKNGADLATAAHGAWDGGLILTLSVCLIAGTLFTVASLSSNMNS